MERFSYVGYYTAMAFWALVLVALLGGGCAAVYLIFLTLKP